MLSLATTCELFRQNWMGETDQAFCLILSKAGTWTQKTRSPPRTSLIHAEPAWLWWVAPGGRYLSEPTAPGYQLPESSGFRGRCFAQMRVIVSKVIAAYEVASRRPRYKFETSPNSGARNLLCNRQGTISWQFACLRSILCLLLHFNNSFNC